jgi:hypothetical protein
MTPSNVKFKTIFAAAVTIWVLSKLESNAYAADTPVTSAWLKENRDQDTDSDGLTDFQERYKYFTDPMNADTDGDGIPDGDQSERREFTYSIANVMEILKPADVDAMNSDYQDAKLREDRGTTMVVEFVYYPLNTVEDGIRANPSWQDDYKHMTSYLAPTRTANWDQDLRTRLLDELAQAGIFPDQLDDATLVRKVSGWIMNTFSNNAPFVAFVTDVENERAQLHPDLEPVFRLDNPNATLSSEYLASGVFGRTMVNKHSIGSCTPSAIVMTTIFRALGIPTRLILTVPAIDANDERQIERASENIKHHGVRSTALKGFQKGKGWASHTYNEVFVGSRWVKLNYNRLAQNNLDRDFFGIMTQVNTMRDWTDHDYPATWGRRILQALNGKLEPVMSSMNQYRSLGMSDLMGRHAKLKNPDIPEHKYLTINNIFTPQDARLPKEIRNQNISASQGVIFLITAKEYISELDSSQYCDFLEEAPWSLTLRSSDDHAVHAEIDKSACFTIRSSENGKDRIVPYYSLWIPKEEYELMAPGIEYKISVNGNQTDYQWFVSDDVVVIKR